MINTHWKKSIRKSIIDLTPYVPGKPESHLIRELNISADKILKLNSNENSWGASPKVLDYLKNINHHTKIQSYPDGNGYNLKTALSEFHQIRPEQLTLGNGSNDILDIIGRVFLDEHSSAIYSQYAFIVYALSVKNQNAKAIEVPAQDYGHNLEQMINAIEDKTQVIFIANPNNPSGTFHCSSIIYNFLKKIPHHIIVVLDEAYQECLDETSKDNHIPWLNEFSNLIIVRSFSKAYGLANLRIGYSISHPEIANYLNRVRHPFNTNQIAQDCAEIALQDQQHIQSTTSEMLQSKRYFEQCLTQLNIRYIPSKGNFTTIELNNAQLVNQHLTQQGILVRPVANYAMPQHLRITIGRKNDMQRVLEQLETLEK